MADFLLLHGPNLNLLGQREPELYGSSDLETINQNCQLRVCEANHQLFCFQSNAEGDLVNRIQQAKSEGVAFIIINPAAYTHTSVAIRDALLAVEIPFIEVHLSNPHRREPFRHHSYFSDIAQAVIAGLGVDSYYYAINAAIKHIEQLS